MKKILLLFALLFQMSICFGQSAQWGPWTSVSCYKGIQYSIMNLGFNKSTNSYWWNIRWKNNYSKAVSFDGEVTIGGETAIRGGWGSLSPGGVQTYTSVPYKSSSVNFIVRVTKVCFADRYGGCSTNMEGYPNYADCDNGTPNYKINPKKTVNTQNGPSATTGSTAPNNQNNSSAPASNPNPVYNNTPIVSLPTYSQPVANTSQSAVNTQRKVEAINQLGQQTIDLISSIQADAQKRKEAKIIEAQNAAIESKKKAERQINTLKDPKFFETYCDFIVANLEAIGFSFSKISTYKEDENGKAATIDFSNNVQTEIRHTKLSDGDMLYTLYFGAKNLVHGNHLANSQLVEFLKQFHFYNYTGYSNYNTSNTKIGDTTYYWYRFTDLFGLDKSQLFTNLYLQGYKTNNYKGGAGEIERYKRSTLDEIAKLNNSQDAVAKAYLIASKYEDLKDYVNAVKYHIISYNSMPEEKRSFWQTEKIADLYYNSEKLNKKDSAAVWLALTLKLMENDPKNKLDIGKGESNWFDSKYTKLLYNYGNSIRKTDGKLAVEIYLKAVRNGYTGAYTAAGVMYELGEGGVEKDWKQAQAYYEKDAEKKGAKAMYYLGQLYEKGGPNLEKDERKSQKWFKNACKADKKYCKNN
ncbi:tetratricopeptide repeat protein [Pedobacter sp. ASV28]|uniref:tetratricopeptide repeat protein n=1 Tax=Pedobacter sp. ASV28 TaxID=2795123 RepID=UPI0018EA925A|nr:tetratricopeptide repeat protein [Pedobacter sp. ASV28]